MTNIRLFLTATFAWLLISCSHDISDYKASDQPTFDLG